MRTQGSVAAILLLSLFCTTARSATINKRTVKSKRENTNARTILSNDDVKKQNPGILVARDAVRINNDSRNVVSKQEDARTSVDQQVDQSEIVLIKDVEDMEHALSIMEYEPQKINKKGKRKIDVPYKNTDNVEFTIENKNPVPTVVSNAYHDPSRISKPKKYSQNPSQEGPKPSDSELRPRSRDPEYPHPVSTLRPNKSRFSKNRPSLQIAPEEAKFENVPTTPRPYSPATIELKKQRHQLEPTVTSTSSSQPPRLIRKKIRKRPRDKLANSDSRRDSQENNYNKSGSSENKNKSKHLRHEDVEEDRNLNSTKSKDEIQSGKIIETLRNPQGGRKMFDRKQIEAIGDDGPSSSTEKTTVSYINYYNSPLEDTDRSKSTASMTPSSLEGYEDVKNSNVFQNVRTSVIPSSFEDYRNKKNPAPSFEDHRNDGSSTTPSDVRESNFYQNVRNSVTPSFEDYRNGESPVTESSLDVYGYDDSPVTRSGFAESSLTPGIYENSMTSAVPAYEATPSGLEIRGTGKETTMTPSSRVFHAIKSPNGGPTPSTTHETSPYYAPSASTLPVGSWTPRTKLNRLKKTEDDEEEADGRNSDVIAEATDLGDENQAPSEHRGGDYRHEHRQIYRNDGDDERYDQKYENNDDVQAEGTHEGEKYESSKEGDGKGAGGGKSEFEEGGGAKREEGYHGIEDEKGEKGYESWHKDEKGSKGHHDKEQHSNHYEEKDGKEKEHKEEGEYHEEHQQGEKGEKAAEFEEKGEHQKGYNTKGQHSVHKKDEFEKRTEFFDEFQEGDDFEKEGEFHREHESSKGGHEKMAHLDKADHEEHYGKKGKHENGKHHHEEAGHKIDEGKEDHYEHEEMHGGKKGREEEEKWGFKKGDDDGGKDHKSDR